MVIYVKAVQVKASVEDVCIAPESSTTRKVADFYPLSPSSSDGVPGRRRMSPFRDSGVRKAIPVSLTSA